MLARHRKKVHVGANGDGNFDRRRCIKTCGRCKKYKSKCNGEEPCTACKTSNAACTYDQKSKRHCRHMSSTGGFSTTAKAIEPSFSGEPPSGSDMQSPQPMGEQLSPLPVPGGLQNIWSETGNWVLEDSSQQDTLDFLPESSIIVLLLGIGTNNHVNS